MMKECILHNTYSLLQRFTFVVSLLHSLCMKPFIINYISKAISSKTQHHSCMLLTQLATPSRSQLIAILLNQTSCTLNSFIIQTFCTQLLYRQFFRWKFYYLIVFVINFHMNDYVNMPYICLLCVIAIHQYDIIIEIVMVCIHSNMATWQHIIHK